MNKFYGYIRVSTQNQDIKRQEISIDNYCKKNNINLETVFIDKATGRNFKRSQYDLLKNTVKPKDTIIIKELDRLGRDMEGLKDEWNYFINRDINLIIIDMPILNTDNKNQLEKRLISDIVFTLLSYLAEKEIENRSQRVKEGMKIAKEKGTEIGRPNFEVEDLPYNFVKYYDMWSKKLITATEFSRLVNVSRSTIYRYIKKDQGYSWSFSLQYCFH